MSDWILNVVLFFCINLFKVDSKQWNIKLSVSIRTISFHKMKANQSQLPKTYGKI